MQRGHDSLAIGRRWPHFVQCVIFSAAFSSIFHVAFGAQVFQITGEAAEAVGLRVGEASEVDPVVVDVRLQEPGADRALGAELADFGYGDAGFDDDSLVVDVRDGGVAARSVRQSEHSFRERR